MSAPATPLVVAVDGPAGSGKSSVSKAVAAGLGFAFLDTGAAYRALTWFALQRGIDVTDADAVVDSVADFDYRIDTEPATSRPDGGPAAVGAPSTSAQRVFVGDTDVTAAIRDPEVSAHVSAVARIGEVRRRLNELFRGIMAGTDHEGIVAEGRDITTVVAPDAPVRILLTASAEVRAARRAGELDGHTAEDVAAQLHARDRADLQVVDFMTAADGVITVDSTDLSFDETVAAVIDVIRSARRRHTRPEEERMTDHRTGAGPDDFQAGPDDLADRLANVDDELAHHRATALRAGLDDYELDDTDLDVLDAVTENPDEIAYLPALPVVAIVGRPNVGKSALVNRILGRREAVVEDVPGVTRDRVSYQAEWNDRRFSVVDTGGWEPDAKGIDASVAAQAEVAIDLADVVMFVVDANVGATSTDEHVVRLLRKTRKPVFLVANKVDDARQEPQATELWSLGLGEPHPVSALHGRGVADLLDEMLRVLPTESAYAQRGVGGPRRVAIVGRPNVGKSSLLNKAAGEERVVVNELAGTTRDPVDEQIELGGRVWRFVDTAGIRRRVHLQHGADFYASLRTSTALEKAEVAVVVIDVTEPISEQDVRIIDLVLESGRALVIAYNKWDLLDDDRRRYLEREIEQDLAHVAWAPRVNISARTGRHLERLVPALETALESWDTRIATGKFNAFLAELTAAHPHPVRGGKQPRILFGTQASSRPPTFVLFTTGFLDPGYRRYVQRRLRELYGFEGTPIVLNMRVREKRRR